MVSSFLYGVLLFQNCTLQIIGHVVEDHISGGLGADGQLLALAQILERDGVLRDLVLAEEEIAQGTCSVKDLRTGQQVSLSPDEAVELIRKGISELNKGSVILEK